MGDAMWFAAGATIAVGLALTWRWIEVMAIPAGNPDSSPPPGPDPEQAAPAAPMAIVCPCGCDRPAVKLPDGSVFLTSFEEATRFAHAVLDARDRAWPRGRNRGPIRFSLN